MQRYMTDDMIRYMIMELNGVNTAGYDFMYILHEIEDTLKNQTVRAIIDARNSSTRMV